MTLAEFIAIAEKTRDSLAADAAAYDAMERTETNQTLTRIYNAKVETWDQVLALAKKVTTATPLVVQEVPFP